MEQVKMSIGVVSRLTGINANTLRMWERRYNLGPSCRSPGGQREYTTTDIDHLKLIRRLNEQGMRIGDVAKLSTQQLLNLLRESGDKQGLPANSAEPVTTLVVGAQLCQFFRKHLKRYRRLAIECFANETDTWVQQALSSDYKIVVIQQSSLHQQDIASFELINNKKIQIVLLYLYASSELIETLKSNGIVLIRGGIEFEQIDHAINRALTLCDVLTPLQEDLKQFDLAIPETAPRNFDEHTLAQAASRSNQLNCECPPHLVDLIRRLQAFEDYSQTCGSENWQQAAIHACIYSYTCQARYLVEKALQAVLTEHMADNETN